MCVVFTDGEIYKPNHDLRELNILLGKPPQPQSGSLGCQLHCDCMCSFRVCKREQDTERFSLWLSNMRLFSMRVHLQRALTFVRVNTCLCLWFFYYMLLIKPKRRTLGLAGAQLFFNKAEAEL